MNAIPIRFGPWIPMIVFSSLLAACAHTPTPPTDALATWNGGTLTTADLAQWQTFQPGAADQALEEQCTDMAMLLFLAAETDRDGVDPETAAAIENATDRLLARRLRAQLASEIQISPEEIGTAFRDHPKAFQTPRKVRLRNLFLHFPPEASEAEKNVVRSQMSDFRQRIFDGEDFAPLAEQESHSQTRFRRGLMGNVSEGMLPQKIDSIVMGLQPGQTSQILESPEGLTLFHCDAVIEARSPTPEDVRERLATNLRRIEDKRRWAELKRQLADDAEISDSAFAPFAAVEARHRGLEIDPGVVAKIRWMTRQRLATEALRRRVERSFEPPSDAEVRAYFESNRSDFISPETFEISVIRLDGEKNSDTRARQAFELSYSLRHGATDFSDRARASSDDPSTSNGGRLEPMTRRQLAGRGPEFMKTTTGLRIGEISREFFNNGSWWIVRLDDRQPSRLMTYNEATSRARSLLTQNRVEAVQEVMETEIRRGLDLEVLQ